MTFNGLMATICRRCWNTRWAKPVLGVRNVNSGLRLSQPSRASTRTSHFVFGLTLGRPLG